MPDKKSKDPFDIEPNADGWYSIEVSDETYDLIESFRIDPNESHNDIITRRIDEYEKVYGPPPYAPSATN